MGKIITKIDQSLCILISMGRLLTLSTNPDREQPEPTCLSDLGRVISNEAEVALELILDLEKGGHDD